VAGGLLRVAIYFLNMSHDISLRPSDSPDVEMKICLFFFSVMTNGSF
jgi:hypothetical protein